MKSFSIFYIKKLKKLTMIFGIKKIKRMLAYHLEAGAEPPPASLAISPGSAPTFLVTSPGITRIFSFFCGFTCGFLGKFHMKHISYRFCHGFRFSGEVILRF